MCDFSSRPHSLVFIPNKPLKTHCSVHMGSWERAEWGMRRSEVKGYAVLSCVLCLQRPLKNTRSRHSRPLPARSRITHNPRLCNCGVNYKGDWCVSGWSASLTASRIWLRTATWSSCSGRSLCAARPLPVVARRFPRSRKVERTAIWFSFRRRASRERFAATLFLFLRDQYFSFCRKTQTSRYRGR